MAYYKTIDITGQKFGKWIVLSRAPKSKRTNSTPALWNVKCDCGTEAIREGINLRNGSTTSCGCSLKELRPERVGKYSREKHHAWKGGRTVDKKGYTKLTVSIIRDEYPNAVIPRTSKREKSMLEHRAVMSHHLKRALRPDETVHHKNGDRSDNRIENLELRSGKHGPGQSISDLVAWAREILQRYA